MSDDLSRRVDRARAEARRLRQRRSTRMTPDPASPTTTDAPNKAIGALVTAITGLVIQWAATGKFTLEQEGVTAIVGAVATIVVYLVSNRRRPATARKVR